MIIITPFLRKFLGDAKKKTNTNENKNAKP